ncbi:hypothetical protein [Acuticoccus sp. I52.16.1]|uniref:hypothetical protein n=1 Tax=Acuticoccus sp. I52.16.1 TaxID=2928472 RepID=UPI001FD38830|nr:hypothetical protein [Acuticoccus sp. I52.16.1]UOM36746.1 hypothetical protein MRB58_11390 [Acuticoccus sp. I52.16.1]
MSQTRVAILLGTIGVFVFVVSIASALSTGLVYAGAHMLISGHIEAEPEPARTNEKSCENGSAGAAGCDASKVTLPRKECAPNENVAELPPGCLAVWRHALELAATTEPVTFEWGFKPALLWVVGIIGNVVTFAAPSPESFGARVQPSLVPMFALATVGIILLGVAVGYGILGVTRGILLGDNNRMSLGKTQVALWTTVIVGAYAMLASFKIGALSVAVTDGNINLFPVLHGWIWAALSISVGSALVTGLVKEARPGAGTRSVNVRAGPGRIDLGPRAAERPDPGDASIADLFLSEEAGSEQRPDLSRVQQVLFTIILVVSYMGALIAVMRETTIVSFLRATGGDGWLDFPDPGATFAALLALSHSAYIVGKFEFGKGESDRQASKEGEASD